MFYLKYLRSNGLLMFIGLLYMKKTPTCDVLKIWKLLLYFGFVR